MDKEELGKSLNKVKEFFSNEKVQWISVIAILLVVVSLAASIRVSNIDLLKDSTTDEYIPLALDPYYFLRVAEKIIETDKNLPECDEFRVYLGEECVPYIDEFMPWILAYTYPLVGGLFDISFRHYDIISPVIFFVLGIGMFFALSYLVTKNKWLSLGASSLLSFTTAYLYRTMAGFSDHESIGMFALFLAFFVFVLAVKYHNNKEKNIWWKSLIWGLAVGLTTVFTIGSWGGSGNFLFIIFPLAYFLVWIFHNREKNNNFVYTSWIFYISWVVSTLAFGGLLGLRDVSGYFTGTTGILSLAILGFILIDGLFQIFNFKWVKEKFRILYSLGVGVIVGFIGLFAIGKNPLFLIRDIIIYLIKPFGTHRVGLTVAENAQPYLSDWISNVGQPIFWLFVFGIVLLGYYLSRGLKKRKHKWGFFVSYVLMVSGIIFSRISASHVLNGDNFISGVFYFVPLVGFWVYFFYLYFSDDYNWNGVDSFLFAWMFFTIISGRAALRMFFAITPFMCFMAAYFIFNICKDLKVKKLEAVYFADFFIGIFLWFLFRSFSWWNGTGFNMVWSWLLKMVFLAIIVYSGYFLYKNSKIKDELNRLFVGLLVLISVFVFFLAIFQSYSSVNYSAQYTGPSANNQWQNAMSWIRENTEEDAVFGHWWDYGYWVQTLGERKTLADGGYHSSSLVHPIGRYVLTTPEAETAYSYLKTMGVDYFLIDPTDLGKYSAYSRIGSDDKWDRYSYLPIGTYDPAQVQETANETVLIYNIQGVVDEDLEYVKDGKKIFLPGPSYNKLGEATYNSYLIGVILKFKDEDELVQPTGVYYYNNQQYQIPIRYIYFGGELFDFGKGYDAVLRVIPSVRSNKVDSVGAIVYLSSKVKDSLFAQVYLMDDPFESYENFELVHSEDDDLIKNLENQGYPVTSEFIYYNGFRGPIKIWNVSDYPERTETHDVFWDLWTGDEEMSLEKYGSYDVLFE